MSFKYRTIGYSPEYAVTTGLTYNDFHNDNNFKSGSTLNFELGSATLVETGATFRITDIPSDALDVTNKSYVDTGLALKLNLSGGILSGSVSFSAGTLTLFADPAANMQASTKQYTDQRIHKDGTVQMTGDLLLKASTNPTLDDHAARKAYVDTKLSLSGGTMTNFITLHANPINQFHAATRSYVDSKLGTFDAGAGLTVAQIDITKSGTYSQTGDTITVTITNHEFGFGTVLDVDFTSGGAPDGSYTIATIAGPHTFEFISGDSASRTGNVTVTLTTNQVSVVSPLNTLDVLADTLDLKTINTGGLFKLTDGAATYASTSWYDKVKVDQFGRVVSAKNTPTVDIGDGTYNNVTVVGGYITHASNIAYITHNDTITLSGDVVGSGQTAITTTLSEMPGLNVGTYTKVTVNTRGRVTSATKLSANDISDALGYLPPKEPNIRYIHAKSAFQSFAWGSLPVNLVVAASDNWPLGQEGFSISGTYMYVPKGTYQVTFYGTSNWWHSWYSNWWWGGWWSNYWTYYYQPAMIEVSGAIQTAAFSNYGGWWWYYNATPYSDRSQDFCLTDSYYLPTNGYLRFWVPNLYGCTYWYNVKVVKLK